MHKKEGKKESALIVQATEIQSEKALLRLYGRNPCKKSPQTKTNFLGKVLRSEEDA